LVPIFEKLMQFGHFVKFLDTDQGFLIKIEVINNDDLLYWCN